MATVEEIMTPNPERAEAADTVREVIGKLMELDIRHLPIVENNELIGMISDRDLRTYTMPLASDFANRGDSRLDTPISTIMQGDVIAVGPDAELGEAIDLMIDHKIGAIPVVDGITGTLVGILSYIDIIRYARDLV